MLLVVGGIKGGTGKTTLATNLAVCRALSGKNVLLLDADEQKSSMDWDNQRKVHLAKLLVEECSGKQVHRRLENEIEDRWFDDIIVDTGGRDTTSQRAALVLCDVFLAPLRPRSMDIWTLNAIKKLEAEIREVNPKFRIVSVLNQCSPRSKDNQGAKTIIQEENIECLKVEIGLRKAFSDASAIGLGVIEHLDADEKSIKEILNLHDDIYTANMLETFNNSERDIWQLAAK